MDPTDKEPLDRFAPVLPVASEAEGSLPKGRHPRRRLLI
jgi:hypothetical protein